MLVLLAVLLLLRAPAFAGNHPICTGDCNGDSVASDVEFHVALELVFDAASFGDCAAGDADGNLRLTSADIVAIVAARGTLPEGCGVAPTASITPTPSPTLVATASPTPPDATPASIWTTLAPLAEGPRQEVGSADLGEAIYVLGGLDERARGSALVERYDIGDDQWTTVKPLPRALHHVGAAALGDSLYCVGGFIGSTFAPTNQVFRYDPSSNEWTEVASLPLARGAPAVVALGGRLHVLGGSSPQGSVSDHTVYDPSANEWSALTSFPGAGRNHLAAVALDGHIYLVGGRFDGGGQSNSAALHRYDPDSNSWTPLKNLLTARSGHAVATLNGRIVAMGGEVNPLAPSGVFPRVEIYDPARDEWTQLDDMPVPRHGLGAVTVGSRIYVPGGATAAGFAATAHHDALEISP